MKVRIISVVAALAILLVFAELDRSQSTSTNLRGKVVKKFQDREVPLPGVAVQLLWYDATNHRWQQIKTAQTDRGGMYYMYAVAPRDYYIRVNDKLFQVKVAPPRPNVRFQDVPKIVL